MHEENHTRMRNPIASSKHVSGEVVQEIVRAIEAIAYGSVEIVIHNSQIVQIERKEKIRFQKSS